MRAMILALIVAAPLSAYGQTPGDIARQVWPAGPPSSSSVAPNVDGASAGAFSPIDLARQIGPGSAASAHNAPTLPGQVQLGTFTGLDLVRLRGGSQFVPEENEGSYRVAGANPAQR